MPDSVTLYMKGCVCTSEDKDVGDKWWGLWTGTNNGDERWVQWRQMMGMMGTNIGKEQWGQTMGMMGMTDTRNDGDNGDGDGYVGRKSTVLGWLLNPTWTTLEKHHNSLRQPLGMVMHNTNNTLILFAIHNCICVLVGVCGQEAPHCPFADEDR